ncbi:MAG: long-chain fatty acid--CoA ligase [Bacteroidota bacterium]|nr:long-chain fatty acid--CoA ligase [Bacteroidota bacterium]
MSTKIERLFDLLPYIEEKYPKDIFLAGKSNGKWTTYSTNEYVKAVRDFSTGLLALGFKSGDKIVSVCTSRPEWNIMDLGMMQAGVVHVPLYPNLSATEYEFQIAHSDAVAVIVGDKSLYNRIKSSFPCCRCIKVFCIDEVENLTCFREILEAGKNNPDLGDKLEEIKNNIKPDDLATIVYTSGTTGSPKGVMLSHANLISNVKASVFCDSLNHMHKVLSFLPLCHVYERMINYHYQYLGISVYYAQNMGTIVNNLNEIQADGFTAVPRFLENMFAQIVTKGKDLFFLKKKVFFWAVNLGLEYEPFKDMGRWYRFKHKVADLLVFKHWRQAFGGNVKMIISGGAALQERLVRIFWAAGMPIQEGYGLSETSPVIAVNGYHVDDFKLGTVGRILENVEVRISDDGEILCKGPNVMLGYYKDPEYTAHVIDSDGWFHTGDIGVVEDKIFLKLTDRKKSIFKLSSGKYIAPQIIENRLKASDFIEQVMVVGENEKHAAAFICPNFNYLHFWASKHKLRYRDNQELISLPALNARIQQEIKKINENMNPHEQIKKFKLVVDEWSPVSGELSASLKLKRDVVLVKYRSLLEEMYGHSFDSSEDTVYPSSIKI